MGKLMNRFVSGIAFLLLTAITGGHYAAGAASAQRFLYCAQQAAHELAVGIMHARTVVFSGDSCVVEVEAEFSERVSKLLDKPTLSPSEPRTKATGERKNCPRSQIGHVELSVEPSLENNGPLPIELSMLHMSSRGMALPTSMVVLVDPTYNAVSGLPSGTCVPAKYRCVFKRAVGPRPKRSLPKYPDEVICDALSQTKSLTQPSLESARNEAVTAPRSTKGNTPQYAATTRHAPPSQGNEEHASVTTEYVDALGEGDRGILYLDRQGKPLSAQQSDILDMSAPQMLFDETHGIIYP